jgi:aspartate kinase
MSAHSVLKFGGAALKDGPSVRLCARIVRERGGERPLVVVSAHQGVTQMLRRAADAAFDGRVEWDEVRVRQRTILRQLGYDSELLGRHLGELRAILEELAASGRRDRRTRDYVLSFGERMAARVFATALREEGLAATPLDAFDLGLVSEVAAGRYLPTRDAATRVCAVLERVPGVPVVTGFLALDASGHVTTLGRNGSDLSAVWLGEAIGAGEVQLWKAVDGVLSADPRLVSAARRIDGLGWEEATDLAVHGAEVLHPLAVEPAWRSGMTVTLRNVHAPGSGGTRLGGASAREGPLAIAHRLPVAVWREPLDPQRARGTRLEEVYARLLDAGLDPFLHVLGEGELWMLLPDAVGLVDALPASAGAASLERGLGAFALVGRGRGARAALDRDVCELCERAGIPARALPTVAFRSSRLYLTRQEDLASAVRVVHRTWIEDERSVELVPAAHAPVART